MEQSQSPSPPPAASTAARRGKFFEENLPRTILFALIAAWVVFGAILIPRAPFASGTDESICYVAFTADTKRWATEADFHRFGIDYYYYPPLYFLCFAPFFTYHPVPPGHYPTIPPGIQFSGGHYNLLAANAADQPSPELDRLYRSAKYFSLLLGLSVIAAVIVTIRAVFPGPLAWWRCLLGVTPILTLPQFIYYSTLCNNDPLCNALSAGTFLAFAFAMLALESKNKRKFFIYGGLAAFLTGLNLLTKTTAMIFAPLLGLLALSSLLIPGSRAARLRRFAGFFAVLALLTLAGGGWWLIHKAFEGDWNSQIAAKIGHPWAFVSVPLWTQWTWPGLLLSILRSYFSLMAGPIHGIPDRLFLLYLVPPAVTIFTTAFLAIRSGPRRLLRGLADGLLQPRLWLYAGAAGMIVANAGAIILNCRDMVTPYGRLLFPTLVPGELLFVSVWFFFLRDRPRGFILFTATNLLFSLGLFLIMAEIRIIPCIVQKPENIATLAPLVNPKKTITGAWEMPIEQMMLLPPGRLLALRLKIERSVWPALGATIEGELVFPTPGGAEEKTVPFEASQIGDNDATLKWTELRLSRAVILNAETPAVIRFHIVPPLFWVKECAISLVAVHPEDFPRMGNARFNERNAVLPVHGGGVRARQGTVAIL